MYTLYKIIESYNDHRGDKIEYVIVSTEEENSFHESMADNFGYQDYNYSFNYKEVATFTEEELKLLITLFNKTLYGAK